MCVFVLPSLPSPTNNLAVVGDYVTAAFFSEISRIYYWLWILVWQFLLSSHVDFVLDVICSNKPDSASYYSWFWFLLKCSLCNGTQGILIAILLVSMDSIFLCLFPFLFLCFFIKHFFGIVANSSGHNYPLSCGILFLLSQYISYIFLIWCKRGFKIRRNKKLLWNIDGEYFRVPVCEPR